MKRNTTWLVMAALLVSALMVAPTSAQAQNPTQNINVEFHLPGGGSFTGTLDLTGFEVVNGVLQAVGSLSGTLRNAAGQVIGTVTDVLVMFPVDLLQTTGTCEILHLVLGPINLELLGLQVTTNQIVVDITAEAGPGNLVGNLLCAVAHLLDRGGPLTGLAGLLNNLLRALARIG